MNGERSGNIRIPASVVEMAIRKHVFETEAAKGKPIQMDQIEFCFSSVVQYVDGNNQPMPVQPFASVVVGWKE